MRRLEDRLLWISVGLLVLAATFSASGLSSWLSWVALPVLAATFWKGFRQTVIFSIVGVVVGGLLLLKGTPIEYLLGPWTALILIPGILWVAAQQFSNQVESSHTLQKQLQQEVLQAVAVEEQFRKEIHQEEESIQQITQEYGLSKQLLGTLELKAAVEIAQEAIAKGLPHLTQEQKGRYLSRMESQLVQGEISPELFVENLPVPIPDAATRERWWMVSGQLALGLKRVVLYRQIQESAIHDGLTNLLVRRYFRERLDEEVARSMRRKTPLAFLMIDLDHFKGVNDSFGHLVGDVVLREVARKIQHSVREIDLVCRYGGEEFGVALPDTDRHLSIQVADRIRDEIGSTPIRAYDEEVWVTVSIGIALFPENATSADGLIERSDTAMYQAKAQGRNRVVATS